MSELEPGSWAPNCVRQHQHGTQQPDNGVGHSLMGQRGVRGCPSPCATHLVAGEAEHHEALAAVLVVQALQLCVLRCEAAGTCTHTASTAHLSTRCGEVSPHNRWAQATHWPG